MWNSGIPDDITAVQTKTSFQISTSVSKTSSLPGDKSQNFNKLDCFNTFEMEN